MLTKTQITDLGKKEGFYLKKRLGQNFLIDKNAREKIIRLLGIEANDVILEIGAGLGALTEALAREGGFVYAIEIDKKLALNLKKILKSAKNLEIINEDFLKFDIRRLSFKGIKIVGAVPYYITTPIIQKIIEFKDRVDTAFITVQKEVAHRMNAVPGNKDYGAFSLFLQYHCDIEILLDINRGVFFPRPEVDSSLVKLKLLKEPPIKVRDENTLNKVIRSAFLQRRKMLSSALSHKEALGMKKAEIIDVLKGLGIDPKNRSEAISLVDYGKIAD
ncbi:MAG: ribosomal RNA small subunit methyltransferase A, partial [Candidatus Omnitrophica bacterium]|nr:ribosomal RNA small subunit methyltransferase A [Candidatus Omnitrophota bacterium]